MTRCVAEALDLLILRAQVPQGVKDEIHAREQALDVAGGHVPDSDGISAWTPSAATARPSAQRARFQ